MSPKQTSRRQTVQTTRTQRKAKDFHADPVWRLPSGKRLAEFALACGFLAPTLMNDGRERIGGGKKA